MIKPKPSVNWIDIKLKLNKEWKKADADKKEKRKTETNLGSLSDLFYKDRGMGLEPFVKEGIRPLNEIHSYKDLIKFLEKIKMTPAATHQIIDRFLFKDKNQE